MDSSTADQLRQTADDFFSSVPASDLWHQAWFRVLVIVLGLMILQFISHRILDRIVVRTLDRHKHISRAEQHKREQTLKAVSHTASSILIWLFGAILILWALRVNISGLLASAGVIGVVAGIGGQSVIKDWLAGTFIILENQLRVDDIVTIATPTATVSGLVEEVNLRSTRLRDLDGNLHILSNGSIGVITNMSFNFAQVNVDINIPYDADIDLAEELIKEAGLTTAHNKKFKDDIIEPIEMLRVDKLGESTITLKALGKVKPGTQWDIAGDFRRNIKKLFDQHKIAAPYANIIMRVPKTKPARK
jgi:small conductance mechanosensitive channel